VKLPKKLAMEGSSRSKKKLLNFGLLTGMLVSVVFLIVAFTATSKCYLEPCYDFDSQASLYQVSKGAGFMLVISALLMVASSIGNLYVLNKALESDYAYGLSLGCTSMVALMLFETSVFWGGQASVLNQLPTDIVLNNELYKANSSTASHFQVVASFAGILFMGEIAVVASFVLYRTQIIMGGHSMLDGHGNYSQASASPGISSESVATHTAVSTGSMTATGSKGTYQDSASAMNQVDL